MIEVEVQKLRLAQNCKHKPHHAGSVREVEGLEDALSQAEAGRLSAEASLAHSSAMQQGDLQTAQQALQAANRDLKDCQARLADLETTNALLIQEQQVHTPVLQSKQAQAAFFLSFTFWEGEIFITQLQRQQPQEYVKSTPSQEAYALCMAIGCKPRLKQDLYSSCYRNQSIVIDWTTPAVTCSRSAVHVDLSCMAGERRAHHIGIEG